MIRTEPFPHILWDNFLSDSLLDTIRLEFPNKDSHVWNWKSNDENSIKYMCQDKNLVKSLKSTRIIYVGGYVNNTETTYDYDYNTISKTLSPVIIPENDATHEGVAV